MCEPLQLYNEIRYKEVVLMMVDVDDKVGWMTRSVWVMRSMLMTRSMVDVDDGDTTMPRYVTKSVTSRLC